MSDKIDNSGTVASLTRIDPSAKTKQSLLNIINDSFSDYQSIELTDEESQRLAKTLSRLSTGAATFALLRCEGALCPFASQCPLVQMGRSSLSPHGKAPVGNDCLLESTIMRDSLASYIQEFDIDPKNYTEVNIVSELAEIETLMWRINMQLARTENALLTIEQSVGVDGEGNSITRLEAHPLIDQKAKLATRKSKLQKAMVGDRQEKYKKEAALKQHNTMDASNQMSDVRKKIKTLEAKVQAASVIEAEFKSAEDLMGGDD